VKSSIINGRTVMWDRVIPGMDFEWLQQCAQELFNKLKKAYSQRDYLNRSIEELFPSSFQVFGRN